MAGLFVLVVMIGLFWGIPALVRSIKEEKYQNEKAEAEQKRQYAIEQHRRMVNEFKEKLDLLEKDAPDYMEYISSNNHSSALGGSVSGIHSYTPSFRTFDSEIQSFRDKVTSLKQSLELKYNRTFSYSELSKYDALLSKYKTSEMKNQEERRKREEEERKRQAEERKRREESERRKALAKKFTYTTIGSYKVAYRYDYYPKNRYPVVSAEQESARKSIWNFKDGISSIGLNVASDFLDGNFTQEQLKKMTFCVVPASTRYKNDVRYKTMCEKLSERFSIQNGFSFITINEDRSDSREQKKADTIGNLSFSSSVYSRDIVLFDDITTRGTSFVQAADALKAKGARSVYGLFLGKTV